MLAARVGVSLGSLELDVDLTVHDGEVVAVLGPNGAGKTTLLRALAGLVALDRGRIEVDGVVLDEPDTGTFVSVEHRPVGVVFQDYLLFAHLSALENVAFGLRARGTPKTEARRAAMTLLDRFGLADHAHHRPRALSGGQAQRVALARALATGPRLLLLDEPLAALDATTRRDVRRDLRRQLASFGGARILVTHDPVDAYALADQGGAARPHLVHRHVIGARGNGGLDDERDDDRQQQCAADDELEVAAPRLGRREAARDYLGLIGHLCHNRSSFPWN